MKTQRCALGLTYLYSFLWWKHNKGTKILSNADKMAYHYIEPQREIYSEVL